MGNGRVTEAPFRRIIFRYLPITSNVNRGFYNLFPLAQHNFLSGFFYKLAMVRTGFIFFPDTIQQRQKCIFRRLIFRYLPIPSAAKFIISRHEGASYLKVKHKCNIVGLPVSAAARSSHLQGTIQDHQGIPYQGSPCPDEYRVLGSPHMINTSHLLISSATLYDEQWCL